MAIGTYSTRFMMPVLPGKRIRSLGTVIPGIRVQVRAITSTGDTGDTGDTDNEMSLLVGIAQNDTNYSAQHFNATWHNWHMAFTADEAYETAETLQTDTCDEWMEAVATAAHCLNVGDPPAFAHIEQIAQTACYGSKTIIGAFLDEALELAISTTTDECHDLRERLTAN